MSTIFYRSETGQERASAPRRAGSFLLAIAIEILLLLAFFTLNFRDKPKPEFAGGRITTFDLSADSATDKSNSPKKQEEQQVAEVRPPPRPVQPTPPPKIKLPPRPLQMIEVTSEVYRAADIAKLGSNAGDVQTADAGSAGRSAGDSEVIGTAPNGEPLYRAEWYREPTHTELATYLPKTMPDGGGWGTIACRTAQRFKVEDCVELDQNPAGSHLAGAVRQAAWQFLVRPPRVGGKSLVGEWVSIRIYYGMGEGREAN